MFFILSTVQPQARLVARAELSEQVSVAGKERKPAIYFVAVVGQRNKHTAAPTTGEERLYLFYRQHDVGRAQRVVHIISHLLGVAAQVVGQVNNRDHELVDHTQRARVTWTRRWGLGAVYADGRVDHITTCISRGARGDA